jgi:hypothetical protein
VLGQVYSFEETSLWVNPERSVYVDSTEAKTMAKPRGTGPCVIFMMNHYELL